jgi:hypothetical protein
VGTMVGVKIVIAAILLMLILNVPLAAQDVE